MRTTLGFSEGVVVGLFCIDPPSDVVAEGDALRSAVVTVGEALLDLMSPICTEIAFRPTREDRLQAGRI